MHHVFWHCCVYLARKFNETRVPAIFPCFPREVEWIDRNAVATKAGTRIERHKPERLRFRSFDNFPDVNSHRAVNELKLINQRDIYATEDVLQQFGRFSHPA